MKAKRGIGESYFPSYCLLNSNVPQLASAFPRARISRDDFQLPSINTVSLVIYKKRSLESALDTCNNPMKLAASQDGFLVHYFVHRPPIEKCMPARISRSWRVRHRISAIRRLEDVGSPETIHPFLIAIFQFAAHLHFIFLFFFLHRT